MNCRVVQVVVARVRVAVQDVHVTAVIASNVGHVSFRDLVVGRTRRGEVAAVIRLA